jgi:hypothetical protein
VTTAEIVRHDPKFSQEQERVIRNLFAKGATDDELAVFLALAKKYDLDPMAKEIWCICELNRDGTRKLDKQGNLKPPMIDASRAGLRKIAQNNELCDGIESGAVYSKDTFERLPNGMVNHQICLDVDEKGRGDRGKLVGAYALVWRKDWKRPAYEWASWTEYGAPMVVDEDGKYQKWSPWYKFSSAMISKAAERGALKQAFPLGAITGVYEREIEHEPIDGDYIDVTPTNVVDADADQDPRPADDAPASAEARQPSDAGSAQPAADTTPLHEKIGMAQLDGAQATPDQISVLRDAAKPLKNDDLKRVVAWATRRDAEPTSTIALLHETRCAELTEFFKAASQPDRRALIDAVVAWEIAEASEPVDPEDEDTDGGDTEEGQLP